LNHLAEAYQILTQYYNTPETNLKLLVNRYLERHHSQDAANTSRTVYGVIRKEKILELVIASFSRTPLKKIDLPTATLLKIGIFLMLFSGGFPDYAIVNEVVSSAPKKSKRFINGILRTVGRQKEKARAAMEAAKDPAIRHSLHPGLIHRIRQLTGEGFQSTLDYLDSEPIFHLKPNPKAISYGDLLKEVKAAEIAVKEIPKFQSLEIKQPGKIKDLVKTHKAYFQNTASQFISFLAGHYAEEAVLDCCAAPGSKTVTLKHQKSDLQVVAADINHSRLRMLQPVIRHNQLDDVSLLAMNARSPALKNAFDLIMVDAPCSSVGTIRKNPDLKLKTNSAVIRRNAEQQIEILDALLRQFPGRRFLYSVCSFTAPETDEALDAISQKHSIETIDIAPLAEHYGFEFKRGRHGLYLLPSPSLNNDLFYIGLFSDGGGCTRPAEPTPEVSPQQPPE
jgi:16S rRNA (cytosine967-C5)-methyltransferase